MAGEQAAATEERGTGMAVWTSRSWRETALAWLDDRLAATGTERTGPADQPHVRPWGTVLKVPTTQGPVWLKAAGPGTAFEAGLYQILHQVAPGHVLCPIAVDAGRGWIVLPDGGPALGDGLSGGDLVDAMAIAMPRYGQLQRDLAPRVADLLGLGVTDMRPAVMPARFDEALAAVSRYAASGGTPEQRAAFGRLGPFRPVFVSWCHRLAAAPGAASLDHNDLHIWNVLASGIDGAARARFYDWGDSVVAHPFASMLIGLGFMRYHLGVGDDDPALLRLRDAYLEAFSDLAPHAELVATLELACRVAKVARALTWHRSTAALAGEDAGEADGDLSHFASAPLQCLCSLLEESYLGGA
jgi:Phosphotransferase enzyme family